VREAPDCPEPYRVFSQGHTAAFEALAVAGKELDRVMTVPSMDLDVAGPRTGGYRGAVGTVLDGTGHLSHPDLAIAPLDEIDTPGHHRIQPAVAD
jgi:putative NADH-flavin reductase